MNLEMQNLANELANNLRAMCIKGQQLYKTGNMKASIMVVQVDENYCDIVIATPYASFTNTRGKLAGWIERSITNTCRAFASNNNVEDLNLMGQITYGGF